MTKAEFDARLAALRNIDRDMVPELDDAAGWPMFRDQPVRFYAGLATPAERDAIWRASEEVLRTENPARII